MTRTTPDSLTAFIRTSLTTAGATASDAAAVAEVLCWADRRGRFPQGSIWIELFIRRLEAGILKSPLPNELIRIAPGRAHLDAADGFGHAATLAGTGAVVEMASDVGIAIVSIANSSHFGAAGFYAERISRSGFVGLSFTNAYAKVAPHGGASAALGTNPFAFALPREGAPPIVGDLSTGAIAGSKVRDAIARDEELPEGVLLDAEGNSTTDPRALEEGGVMLPFAGPKGFALGLLVEALTGGLSGGPVGSGVGSVFDTSRGVGVSHALIAVDPGDGGFAERMAHLADDVLATPAGAGGPVRMPGDAGHRAELEAASHIQLPADTVAKLEVVAAKLGVDPPWAG